MLIRYGYEMTMTFPAPTAVIAVLDVHHDRAGDVMQSSWSTDPVVPTTLYVDAYGNHCRRFLAPAGRLLVRADGLIRDSGAPDPVPDAPEVPVAELPDECILYTQGSRYCETDRLSQTAWNLFGHLTPGAGRVQAIFDFVHQHLTFGYQYARSTRTALEGFEERVGVCRDFAHLSIALCRAMNIPARYVNGYLGDIGVPKDPAPMDFSAWSEVYLGDRWWTFDARHNRPRIGRIVIARGRDATDVPLVNSFGPHSIDGFRVWTDEVDQPIEPPMPMLRAV